MEALSLDTHVVVWLYEKRLDLLSENARRLIEKNDLWISPMVQLELQYLYEIGRKSQPATEVITYLTGRMGLMVRDLSLVRLIANATLLPWTRDPFDRMIVSHAQAQGCQLLTADKIIRQHFAQACW